MKDKAPKTIRVRISKCHKQLYDDLKKQNIGDAHTVFFIAVCIGYSTGQRKPFEKDAYDRFHDHNITPREMAVYQSIFLNENAFDLQTINKDEEILRMMEEYANGGVCHIIENIIIGFDVRDDGECVVKESEAANLPQRLLSLIIQTID